MTTMLTVMRNYQSVQNILDNEQDRIVKAMPILSGSQQQA
jgi:flagellar basal body rod protein FlgG